MGFLRGKLSILSMKLSEIHKMNDLNVKVDDILLSLNVIYEVSGQTFWISTMVTEPIKYDIPQLCVAMK